MQKAILSVVRYKAAEHGTFEDSRYNTDAAYRLHHSEEQRRKWFKESCEGHDAEVGRYIKSGGGSPTDDLQQAQIFGWSRRAKETLASYESTHYDIIPILLTPAE